MSNHGVPKLVLAPDGAHRSLRAQRPRGTCQLCARSTAVAVPVSPCQQRRFRKGAVIISACCFSRSPLLANPASGLSRRVRSSKRAKRSQLCARSRAAGWGTRGPCRAPAQVCSAQKDGLSATGSPAKGPSPPPPAILSGENGSTEPRDGAAARRGAVGSTGAGAPTASLRYFNSAA